MCLLGEGVIGRREDSERTFALQRIDQTGRGYCGDQRLNRASANSGADDVFGVTASKGGICQESSGGEREQCSAKHVNSSNACVGIERFTVKRAGWMLVKGWQLEPIIYLAVIVAILALRLVPLRKHLAA